MAKRIIIACIFSIVTLLACGGLAHASHTEHEDDPIIFRDNKSDYAFALFYKHSNPEAGSFQFYLAPSEFFGLPEGDVYMGDIPLKHNGETITIKGEAKGRYLESSGPLFSVVDKDTEVSIRVDGEVNRAEHTASIQLWIDGQPYQITTLKPDIKAAQELAKQIAAAINDKNYEFIYDHLMPFFQKTIPKEEFLKASEEQSDGPVIKKVELNGRGEFANNGVNNYYKQPLLLITKEKDGSTGFYVTDLYLLEEKGKWYYVSEEKDNPKRITKPTPKHYYIAYKNFVLPVAAAIIVLIAVVVWIITKLIKLRRSRPKKQRSVLPGQPVHHKLLHLKPEMMLRYPGSEVIIPQEDGGLGRMTFASTTLICNDSPQKIFEWYDSQLTQGWIRGDNRFEHLANQRVSLKGYSKKGNLEEGFCIALRSNSEVGHALGKEIPADKTVYEIRYYIDPYEAV